MKSRVKPMALGCALQLIAIIMIIAGLDAAVTEASIWFFLFGFMAGDTRADDLLRFMVWHLWWHELLPGVAHT